MAASIVSNNIKLNPRIKVRCLQIFYNLNRYELIKLFQIIRYYTQNCRMNSSNIFV